MKKFFITIFFSLIIISLVSCGKNKTTANLTAKEITDKIIAEFSTDTMSELTEDRIENYYNLDLDILEDYSIYVEGSGGFADEVAVFKAKSTDDVEKIKQSINDRIDSRTKDFEGYNAEEIKKIEDNIVEVNGKYILFVVSDDTGSAEEIFQNVLSSNK